MKIGLVDVDGHNFPNLALMRISAYHKAQGDSVEWWWSDLEHYDIVYMSKIFSDAYTKDIPTPVNADRVIKGGTGYQIHLIDGKEVYDKETDHMLPPEIESMFPDYSIYPQYGFAVAMTSRGCPRGCPFCHVKDKEGRKSVKVADVSDFWNGQKLIHVCDPNIMACRDKKDLLEQYKDTNALIEFNQGLDIRLMTEEDMHFIDGMRIHSMHFAWDNPSDDLESKFRQFADIYHRHGMHGAKGTVYCLTNYEECSEEEHIERALTRIYTLRGMGFSPFVMIYNRPSAPKSLKRLQRWCNNKYVFWAVPKFEDMDFKKA